MNGYLVVHAYIVTLTAAVYVFITRILFLPIHRLSPVPTPFMKLPVSSVWSLFGLYLELLLFRLFFWRSAYIQIYLLVHFDACHFHTLLCSILRQWYGQFASAMYIYVQLNIPLQHSFSLANYSPHLCSFVHYSFKTPSTKTQHMTNYCNEFCCSL